MQWFRLPTNQKVPSIDCSYSRCLILQDCQRKTVIISGGDVAYLRLCLLQLCLTEFNNRSQSKMIAGLRETERKVCLIDELLRNRQPVVSCLRVKPTRAHVA